MLRMSLSLAVRPTRTIMPSGDSNRRAIDRPRQIPWSGSLEPPPASSRSRLRARQHPPICHDRLMSSSLFPSNPRGLFLTDLDGTLLGPDRIIPKRSVDAIRQANDLDVVEMPFGGACRVEKLSRSD